MTNQERDQLAQLEVRLFGLDGEGGAIGDINARLKPVSGVKVIEHRFVRKTPTCWVWDGARLPKGYGYVSRNGKPTYAHRAAWVEEYGPIPDGLFVLHRCDNPPCVRPDHLFLGTPLDNMRDMIAKGRSRNPHAKLDPKAVADILARSQRGEPTKAIAAHHEINPSSVWKVLKRERARVAA